MKKFSLVNTTNGLEIKPYNVAFLAKDKIIYTGTQSKCVELKAELNK